MWLFFLFSFFFLMWIVFYYCQTSLNIAAPDRPTGTMWRVGAFRQWSDIGTASFDFRRSSALMRVTHASNIAFPPSQMSTPQPGLDHQQEYLLCISWNKKLFTFIFFIVMLLFYDGYVVFFFTQLGDGIRLCSL